MAAVTVPPALVQWIDYYCWYRPLGAEYLRIIKGNKLLLPQLHQVHQESLLKAELSLDSAICGTDRRPCGSFNLEKDPALCCLEIFS